MKRKYFFKRKKAKKKKYRFGPGIRKTFAPVGSYFFKFSCFILGIAMISFLFASVYEYLLKSPYMKLEGVVISGVDREIRKELIESSGLSSDLSLLSINIEKLKEKMEKHSWVRSVDLEKRFPRTLVIRVEKEVPRAVIAADQLYYMNRWGRIFKRADQSGDLDYPIITGISIDDKNKEKQLQWAVNILNTVEPEKRPWSMDSLSEIHIQRDGNVLLYFASMPVVQLKGAELGPRMADLKKLVEHLNDTGKFHLVRAINLNYRDGAVVSFVNG